MMKQDDSIFQPNEVPESAKHLPRYEMPRPNLYKVGTSITVIPSSGPVEPHVGYYPIGECKVTKHILC